MWIVLLLLGILFLYSGIVLIRDNRLQESTYSCKTMATILNKDSTTKIVTDNEQEEFLKYTFFVHLLYFVDGKEYSHRYRVSDEYFAMYKKGDQIEVGHQPNTPANITFGGFDGTYIQEDLADIPIVANLLNVLVYIVLIIIFPFGIKSYLSTEKPIGGIMLIVLAVISFIWAYIY